MTIAKAVEAYAAARAAKEAVAEAAKQAEADFRSAERKLVDTLLDSNMTSIKDTAGRLFSLKPNFRFNMTLAGTPEIRAWLAERGEDDSQFVREELMRAPVKEFLQKIHEKEGEPGIPAVFGLDTTPGISVRGWKGCDDES